MKNICSKVNWSWNLIMELTLRPRLYKKFHGNHQGKGQHLGSVLQETDKTQNLGERDKIRNRGVGSNNMAEVLYFVECVKERKNGQIDHSLDSIKTTGTFPISACLNSLDIQIWGCNLRWHAWKLPPKPFVSRKNQN